MTTAPSIGGRLAVLIMLQAFAVLGTVCLGVYWAVDVYMARAHERLLDIKINKLNETAQIMLRAGDPRYQALLNANAPRRPGTHLELLHADGRVFYRDADAADSANALPAERREKRFSVPFADGSETLQGKYAIDIGPDVRTMEFLRAALLMALILGSASAGFIAHLAVRRGLRPLVDLALQTQRMAPHRLGERLALNRPAAELQPWIEQFNALMERLEQSYRQLESFNADVAHELRTPLSALIGRTEVALSRERSVEVLRETLQSNLEDLQRLSDITNDMLFLSRADRGERARRDAPTSFARLVSSSTKPPSSSVASRYARKAMRRHP
jgi:two-component system heavy metal sensor histidine kinase CusS